MAGNNLFLADEDRRRALPHKTIGYENSWSSVEEEDSKVVVVLPQKTGNCSDARLPKLWEEKIHAIS